MDLTFDEATEDFRAEVRDFLSASAATPFAIAAVTSASAKPIEANPGKGAWVRWLDG